MEIHEITKRQRTDEGLLDKVKSTISAVKTKAVTAGDRWQEKQWDKTQDKEIKKPQTLPRYWLEKGSMLILQLRRRKHKHQLE